MGEPEAGAPAARVLGARRKSQQAGHSSFRAPAHGSLAAARLAARWAWPWACGLAAVLTLLGVWLGGRASWGDVATWVLAVTTLLAFVAAAFAGLVAYQLLAVESARDLRAEEERAERRDADRRAQAARVTAWYGTWRSRSVFPQSPMPDWPAYGAVIRNASDLPVYDVRVAFCIGVDPAAGVDWRSGMRYSSPDLIPVVPPGEERAEIPNQTRDQEAAGESEAKWLVALEFTDAAGHRWLRDPRGRLTPS